MKRITLTLLLFICITTFSKAQENNQNCSFTDLNKLIEETKNKYAPDKRTEIFEITISENSADTPILIGKTSSLRASHALIVKAKKIYPNLIDSIITLPVENDMNKVWATVNISVADMRVSPSFSSEMATQALFGTPVRIYETKGSWSRVQTPDQYIGWIENLAIKPLADDFNMMKLEDKLIFTDYHGFAYAQANEKSQHVSDFVAGALIRKVGEQGDFYKIVYPDQREAYIKKSQCQLFTTWVDKQDISAQSILAYAKSLMGIPYVWGGTSTKGIDCSGFTKTVYFMHGVVIPRDASQQVYIGQYVDINNYTDLKPGDLMFFGKKGENGSKDRIRHVGFYLGNKEFIHASGYVRIGSLDPNQPHYDELNTKEFVQARRITQEDLINRNGVSEIMVNSNYHYFIPPVIMEDIEE